MTRILILAAALLALLWWKATVPKRPKPLPLTWRQDDYESWQRDWERWAR